MAMRRRGLNLLEVCYKMVREAGTKEPVISHEIVREAYQKKVAVYDKTGEMHYDLISALHKSMRGSDVDASLYWLARMIEGGEDPLYIIEDGWCASRQRMSATPIPSP